VGAFQQSPNPLPPLHDTPHPILEHPISFSKLFSSAPDLSGQYTPSFSCRLVTDQPSNHSTISPKMYVRPPANREIPDEQPWEGSAIDVCCQAYSRTLKVGRISPRPSRISFGFRPTLCATALCGFPNQTHGGTTRGILKTAFQCGLMSPRRLFQCPAVCNAPCVASRPWEFLSALRYAPQPLSILACRSYPRSVARGTFRHSPEGHADISLHPLVD
jgi:hypothetical protein